MKNTRIELGMEELELVNGGGLFTIITNAIKDAVERGFDTVTGTVIETCKEYVIKPANDIINHPYDLFTNIRVTGLESLADLLTGN